MIIERDIRIERTQPSEAIEDEIINEVPTPEPTEKRSGKNGDAPKATPDQVPAPAPSSSAKPATAPEADVEPATRKVAFSKSINFVVNTDQLDLDDEQTEKNLEELWTYMKGSCDDLQVIIEGHASADGPPERNQELSELRANRIKQWLIENGISESKIRSAVGRGSSSPKVVEPSGEVAKKMSKAQLEALRSKNRRIEVVVVRDCK